MTVNERDSSFLPSSRFLPFLASSQRHPPNFLLVSHSWAADAAALFASTFVSRNKHEYINSSCTAIDQDTGHQESWCVRDENENQSSKNEKYVDINIRSDELVTSRNEDELTRCNEERDTKMFNNYWCVAFSLSSHIVFRLSQRSISVAESFLCLIIDFLSFDLFQISCFVFFKSPFNLKFTL